MSNNIQDKVIIITGASSGMGEAAARHLASEGAKVVLAARRVDRIKAIAEEIIQNGGQALAVSADVTDYGDMNNLAKATLGTYGVIDVLINNAGVMPLSMIEQLKVDEWNQMIDVNLKGVLNGIAAVLPHMKERKSGHIITTASVAAHKIFPASAVYSATKFAVRALCEGLRGEVIPYNIRTTTICPGAVRTELLEHISDEDIKAVNESFCEKFAIPASSYAHMVAFAIAQPEYVDVSEIIFRPTAQEL